MESSNLTKTRNLLPRLQKSLSPEIGGAVGIVVGVAEEQERTLYLVGGGVRDLVLGQEVADIDVVAEDEVESLAERAAAALGGRCVGHRAFGTVTLEGEGFRIDLAMARAETYTRPGALPRVKAASIDDDLARRDFTINAMALRLCGRQRGRLLDPFHGMGDIASGLVRVLHDRSFIDDATRILRAVRYATRFSFHVEKETLGLLKRDLPYLDTISGARLRHEILRLLAEQEPEKGLLRCQELGVLAAIHQALHFDDELAGAFRRARRAGGPLSEEPYLALLGTRLSPADAEAVAVRLSLSKRQRRALEGAARLGQLLPSLSQVGIRPSQVVERLRSYAVSAVEAWALLASRSVAGKSLRRYLKYWRYVKPSLDGKALQGLGVARGPEMSNILGLLAEARLDGRVSSRQEEVELVQDVLEGKSEASRTGGGEE
jgi:tRNA nucleotidyltransferase (CCA-adding enzyme)